MSFEDILLEIAEGCGGGIGAALMQSDGIPIAEVMARPGAPAAGLAAGAGAPPLDDVGAAGVEFGRVLDEIRKASDSLAGGAVAEVVVCLARFTLVLTVVEEDAFLAVALLPDGNLGKARYLIRRNLFVLREACQGS